jgi:cytochrome c553
LWGVKKIFDCKLELWPIVFWATLSGCQTDSWESPTSDSSRRPEAIVAECTLCHSTQEVQRGPILHGMDNWYLLDQIQKFHSGVRGRDSDNRSEYLMGSAVKKIRNDYEMALAANWFSKQEPLPAIRTVKGDLEAGAELYATRCASCHGEEAEGKRETLSPSLTCLEGWYFLDQMKKFRSGDRGNNLADLGGKSMSAAVNGMSNQQFKDVVAYVVETFGPPEAPSWRDKILKRISDSKDASSKY